MLWPARLAILYPATVTTRNWWWVAALGILTLSIVSIWAAERRPCIPVGWFWFLGMLVPVIGLVQVGRQATADRYTYMPLIGLFLIIVFGINEALGGLRARKYVLLVSAGLTITACMWTTRTQLQYLSNSRDLWTHDLDIAGENEIAHINLALALQEEGKIDQA